MSLVERKAVPGGLLVACFTAASIVDAQERERSPTVQADPVVVTATRVEGKSFDVPASIDALDGARIEEQGLTVNISDSLQRVPGIVANNRQNYAQDLQISIRGFGSRATFGVRGVRLIQDGIPLTMPDGQGQTAVFDLDSVKRIEVLRGPFAALYGNSSGGVIQVFTADGPPRPTLAGSFALGSYDTWRAGAKFGGELGPLNYTLDGARFSTDGYRDHSKTRRDSANLKLRYTIDERSSVSLLGNHLRQPETEDPLGLTRAQVAQDPRQAGTNALAFNTRKSVDHDQAGLAYERRLTDRDTIRLVGYGGRREVLQYLGFTGVAITSSGGVVDLDRDFWGSGLQWVHGGELAGGPTSITIGLDYDRMQENRKGFVNNNGFTGALRRNEDDTVYNFDQYIQAEWRFVPRWRVSGGVRHSTVKFDSRDFFIVAGNPNDSGNVSYSSTSPVVGLLYELTPAVNLYAAAGRGFETPTFAELAYRPDGSPGLNFNLRASKSRNYEVGAKAFLGQAARVNLAVFETETKDEIVTALNVGGRSSFTNAGKTRRVGLELAADASFGAGFTGYLAWTYIDAEFKEYSNVFTGQNLSGRKLPGVPKHSLYAELAWRYARSGSQPHSKAVTARRCTWMTRTPPHRTAIRRSGFEPDSSSASEACVSPNSCGSTT